MDDCYGQTNQLHWGALEHVPCAPQLMSYNFYVCACVYEKTKINVYT